VRLIVALALALAVTTACEVDRTIVVNNPTPTRTPSPTPTIATPSPLPTPTPSPAPTPLVSSRGSIVVKMPLANSRVNSPLTISGDASVFEAALQWQVTDTAGRVLAKGFATASAGAPERGTFSITATYADPTSEVIGFAEVYTVSPRDGTIDEIVRVPLVLSPKA
jgi:immunoglobulin-like protein involved in spore germination